MSATRTLIIASALLLAAPGLAHGQATASVSSNSVENDTTPSADDAPDTDGDWGGRAERRANRMRRRAERNQNFANSEWSFSATATTYIVPDDRDYVQPTLTADRDWLHLEARYNYENLETGSVFAGYNMSFGGDKLSLEVTPILGAVFGDSTGVAPGYEISLAWNRFEIYTEGEYLFDCEGSSESFFYSWSEFTYSPTDWLRVGIVLQRTKAYQTDLDVQRGLLLGLTYKQLDFTAYVFNLGWEDPTVVLSVGIRF